MMLPKGGEIIERHFFLDRSRLYPLWSDSIRSFHDPVPPCSEDSEKEEIPEGYWLHLGVVTNIVLAVLGLLVTFYLIIELK